MSNLYKTISYRGIDINIFYDELAESPRDYAEHFTTIWCNSRSYRADGKSIDDLLKELDLERFPGSFKNLCDIADKKGYFAVPVYALIHSGISLSLTEFSDKWDSGTFGIVTIPKQLIYEEYGCKRISKKITKTLITIISAELNEYEAFANGFCFRFEISDGDDEDDCGGFYGDDFENNGLMDYARSMINGIIESRKESAVEFWSDIDKDTAA